MTQLDDNILITLGGLKQASDTIISTLSEDRKAAATYRTEIRAEIAGLRQEYNSVQSDLKLIKEKVEKMEPKVEALESKRQRDEGASRFGSSLLTGLGKVGHLFSGALGAGFTLLIERVFHK